MKLKITKFVHSCLLVETPDRVAIFDPGSMSEQALGQALDAGKLDRLDDIFITHIHGDHMSLPLIKQLVAKFPEVHITTTGEAVKQLDIDGIKAAIAPPPGISFFDSPHEGIPPMMPNPPAQIGVHYLDVLSDPGDSHSFHETKAILALPVQAPWGSTMRAVQLVVELRPKHVLPIHDWHWSDEARTGLYHRLETLFSEQGITFHKLQTGVPVEINL